MIAIEHVLLSDSILSEQFVCDLSKCKGACCVDGDAGAPLEEKELKVLDKIYPTVKKYMTPEGIAGVEKDGRYVYEKEFGWVTPTLNQQICVYGFRDENGIVKCAIEQAWMDKKIKFKKPISCHLFPVIVKKSRNGTTEYANYEPREDHCKPACSLGKKLKVPVFAFLKEPLVRKFGEKFYEALEACYSFRKSNKQKDET